jgi:hypothetical protein
MELSGGCARIRGFNYMPSSARNDIEFWRDYDAALVERELTYAQRLGLNAARVFLAYVVYEQDKASFLMRLRHLVRAAHERGIYTMPVLWDSCFSEVRPTYDLDLDDWVPNPGVQRLSTDFWPAGEAFCRDLVQTLGPEPGLLCWDVMNEPTITSYVRPDAPEREQRLGAIWAFVHHFCGVLDHLDARHLHTVGVAHPGELAQVADDVDLLSFHDYSPNRATIRARLGECLQFARRVGKAVVVSEVGCLARANPYDVTLAICDELGIGWFLWELMIGASRWRDIHGVVYPDGTVRDPSIVAAIRGFYRRRRGGGVAPRLDKEGYVRRVLAQARCWLEKAGGPEVAGHAEGLGLLEVMANLLEAGELVPMNALPSARVCALQEESPAAREELCRLLAQWSEVLSAHAE